MKTLIYNLITIVVYTAIFMLIALCCDFPMTIRTISICFGIAFVCGLFNAIYVEVVGIHELLKKKHKED